MPLESFLYLTLPTCSFLPPYPKLSRVSAMAQSCPVMSGHDEGVEMERAPSARPAGSAPRQRKHGKKRAAKPKARPHSFKEAVVL